MIESVELAPRGRGEEVLVSLVVADRAGQLDGLAGLRLLTGWPVCAQRCRLRPVVTLAKTIDRYGPLILNAVEHGLSNARFEATNIHLQLMTRRAYGYRSPESLIAMAELTVADSALHAPDDHDNPPTNIRRAQ